MLGLPFDRIIALDFEFISESGAIPIPICMVARELSSDRVIRLWQDDLALNHRSRWMTKTLFVGYFTSAEWGCFLALGWLLPTRILDLYSEFRNATNGLALPNGRGLLGALSHHGIPSITAEQKDDERALVMRGGPYTSAERDRILDYCQTDVEPLGALLERMLPGIHARPNGLGQALLRGRYTAAVAKMEFAGVPIDYPTLQRLRSHWASMKRDLIAVIDEDYGVYEGTSFKEGLFHAFLVNNNIDWPRTATGHLKLDRETFRDQARRFPRLEPLKELRNSLSELRLAKARSRT